MCGICGVVRSGRLIDAAGLGRMTHVLAHRGPDGGGTRILPMGADLQAGLGHRRLRIIDLSESADQPMTNEDGSVWVVFNGEIYNFEALRIELIAKGHTFRTQSDTEVIVHLYEQEGTGFLRRLDGMFALAVWDQARKLLVLGRDRAGKKPLFYARLADGIVFASEIKALFQYPGLEPAIDTAQLEAFFLWGYVPNPDTFYRGVKALAPGHSLLFERGKSLIVRPYWDVPLGRPQHIDDSSAIEGFRERLTEAVRRRLVADVPLGAFLSGGLDSSVVVALMSRLSPEPIRTFSIGFSGDPHFDERHYARLVAECFHTRHTEFVVEPSAIDLIEDLVWHHDGPFADSSAIPTYLLSRLTREHVTVALNGDGGDELLAGYLRFAAALWAERVPGVVRAGLRAGLGTLPDHGGPRTAYRRLLKFARSASLPFLERFTRWNAVFYEDLPRLIPQVSAARVPAPVSHARHFVESARGTTTLNRLLYLNFKTYLLDDLLVKMDRSAMAHGLETRSPFLDTELIEFVFSLPDRLKLRGLTTKWLLREAFRDLLPPAVRTRGKMGFGVPLQKWFAADLKDYVRDLLLSPNARLRAYLNSDYIGRLIEEHASGRVDNGHRLWTLLTFEVWLQSFDRLRASAEAPATSLTETAARSR